MELGLPDLLSLPKRIFMKGQKESRVKTTGERLRLFMEELGPTFIKLGQFASTRSDVLSKDIIIELEKLQDHVPPFPSQEARDILQKELGHSIEEVFSDFHETPLAAASIGQVHYAVLKSGDPVAIKIQRPNIVAKIKTDLEILKDLALLAEKRLEWASRYQILDMIEEFSNSLVAELNYTIEGRSIERIDTKFNHDETIYIPKVYWEYSTQKVLTMEFINGTKLHDKEQLKHKGLNPTLLAKRVVNSMFQQIFIDGFFHGDPHPGNLLALPDERIVFIDFGLTGRVSSTMKNDLSLFVIALMQENTDGMIKAIHRMGMVPEDVNMQELRRDVDRLRDKYYDVPLSEVSLGESVHDLFSVAYHHQIQIPSDLTLLGKTLLSIEGMVEKLDPELSIIKLAEPYGRQLLKARYHPKNVARHVINDITEFGDMLSGLPDTVQDLKSVIKKGKVRLEISIPKLDESLKKLDRISNRLSFSIVLLSFSIIMTGLIIGSALVSQSTPLWDIPVIEIGFIIAILMFLWILFAIFRSGRF
ncbi:2-octaprenylphenol hydroxylase [Oceanobacillus limi]|uniref:2-octaprenylphenol hydroxylase n=1 Tax=Oceanobacillus limi TaxID=930131 RepID=A0A1I0HDI2_9BACI|nr:AarF/ABC1/UbiB kinase family protein [Oceanobacillus limi]SET81899.1 2-octaprenylphenol hydroxylase [Oceanobacillus limi]